VPECVGNSYIGESSPRKTARPRCAPPDRRKTIPRPTVSLAGDRLKSISGFSVAMCVGWRPAVEASPRRLFLSRRGPFLSRRPTLENLFQRPGAQPGTADRQAGRVDEVRQDSVNKPPPEPSLAYTSTRGAPISSGFLSGIIRANTHVMVSGSVNGTGDEPSAPTDQPRTGNYREPGSMSCLIVSPLLVRHRCRRG
jgi:hypothetical protein